VLSTFGLGSIFCSFLPHWLAYMIAGVLVTLIEVAQAAFGRPLMKRLVKKQKITFGMVSRVIGFTLLSIGIGALSFYMVIMDNHKSELNDNLAKSSKLLDSINRSYKSKNSLLLTQMQDLNEAKKVRFRGLLMPEELKLQSDINRQLSVNDSLRKTETANIEKLYPTVSQSTNWTFSPEKFAQMIGSLLAVLILGFLTVYSHYIDFKYAKGIADESSNILEYEGEYGMYDEISAQRIKSAYLNVYHNLPGYEGFLLPEHTPAGIGFVMPQAMPQPEASPVAQTTAQPKNEIGFKFPKEINDNDSRNDTRNESRVGDGNRICPICDRVFTYKNTVHKYCSDECRHEAHYQRTGKRFHIKKS
jgi:energy-coupling factor transporter transmembrane protein EcfT